MNVLITNDDGIEASNLLALANAAASYANIRVVAPKNEQSGVGHSFSYYRSLQFMPAKNFPCEAFWVNGTPADCVKFALKQIYKDFKFELVISGVNNGDNAGVASFYSGTVGAAREAALFGVPAIAVSLQKQSEEALNYALEWVKKTLQEKNFTSMPRQTLWNFNVPACSKENPCKGVRIAYTGTRMFNDYYVEADTYRNYLGEEESVYSVNGDSSFINNSYQKDEKLKAYNLKGDKDKNPAEGTDDWWLSNGYASLSPQSIDLTDKIEYNRLKQIFY